MSYADGSGAVSCRRIRPLAIWNLADGWMFSGWCELREGFRTFRFDRVGDLAVTDVIFDEDEAKALAALLTADQCEQAAG